MSYFLVVKTAKLCIFLISISDRFIAASEEFRTEYRYNNLMYFLLGHVTEVIGGAQWEQLLSSRLFEPSGMVDTALVYDVDVDNSEIATPYMIHEGNLREVGIDYHVAKNAYLGTSGLFSYKLLCNF